MTYGTPRSIYLLITVSLTTIVYATQPSPVLVREISSVAFGTNSNARRVVLSGSRAFIADSEAGLEILDVSDPVQPRKLANYPVGSAHGLAVAEPFVFVGDIQNQQLLVLDVSNPSAPRHVRSVGTGGLLTGLATSGGYVYGSAGWALYVVDPVSGIVGACSTEALDTAVTIGGDHAFLAAGASGVVVVDISNPKAPRRLGSFAGGGNISDVCIEGKLAYLADRSVGLEIWDISDLAVPKRLSAWNRDSLVGGNSVRVILANQRAFVCDDNGGLNIIDIRDPYRPTWVARFADAQNASGVAVSGKTLFVADGPAGLKTLSLVEEPVELELVTRGSIRGFPRGLAYDSHSTTNRTYVAAGSGGLMIIDTTDVSRPRFVSNYTPLSIRADAVAVCANLAFVNDVDSGKIHVVDIAEETKPRLLDKLSIPGPLLWKALIKIVGYGSVVYVLYDQYVGLVDLSKSPLTIELIAGSGSFEYLDLFVAEGRMAVCGDSPAFQLFELSDPLKPTPIGQYLDPEVKGGNVALAGDSVYLRVFDDRSLDDPNAIRELRVIDVSNPQSPQQLGATRMLYPIELAVFGSNLYSADSVSVQTFDVSDPTTPRLANRQPVDNHDPKGLSIVGSNLFIANGSFGIRTLDISRPPQVSPVGFFLMNAAPAQLTVSSNYAYVAQGYGGFDVFDIADVNHPAKVATYEGKEVVTGVATRGRYAFISDWAGFHALDVSDPSRPVHLGKVETPGAGKLVLDGNHAFSSTFIVDISDPASPRFSSRLSDGHQCTGIAVRQSLAYVTGLWITGGRLDIFDVSNPTVPIRIGELDSAAPNDVAVSGNIAVVADYFGLTTYDVSGLVPVPLGKCGLPFRGLDVEIAGDLAFVIHDSGSVQVISIADPAHPYSVAGSEATSLGNLPYFLSLSAVGLAGNVIFGGDEQGSIRTFELAPVLRIGLFPSQQRTELNWSARFNNWILQETSQLGPSAVWSQAGPIEKDPFGNSVYLIDTALATGFLRLAR